MNKLIKKIACMGVVFAMLISSVSCERKSNAKEDSINNNENYVLKPIGNYNTQETYKYTNEGIKQSPKETFVSDDGLCTIVVYPDYYDVTLDYEKGTPSEVGASYARTIMRSFAKYEEITESYIYENIRLAFSGQAVKYEAIEERMNVLLSSIQDEYRTEIISFAKNISEGEKGFLENGDISYEEAIIMQMIPDALRGTSCSALSLWGSKTQTGKGITLRCLEWSLGSENQICRYSAIVHMKKGDRSITSIGILGVMDIISAVNDDGVFVGILDVGANDYPFAYEGKMCYTYAIRHALEEYDNATDTGNYMVKNSGDFTWCHNLIITDANNSYCAENCVQEVSDDGKGFSVLRDAKTPIMDGLDWDSEDSLCVLNSFMTEGNMDYFSGNSSNLVRFEKYNKWVLEKEKFSVADVKDMITQEKVDQSKVINVHRNGAVHLVIIDYATDNIQIAFTGDEGVVDKPVFIDAGSFRNKD